MIPLLVTIAGLLVIVLCIYAFKVAGSALYRRRMREAIEADEKTFASIEAEETSASKDEVE
jgi:hypothetical protein